MNLVPKYKIGDIVYQANTYPKRKDVVCPDCMGKEIWSVKTPSGEEFTIPCHTCECGFETTGKIGIYIQSASVTILTIGSVRIDTGSDRPISYMCKETGIGSGSVYYEETLFKNKEDALKYATEKAVEVLKEKQKEQNRILALGKKRSRRNPLRK